MTNNKQDLSVKWDIIIDPNHSNTRVDFKELWAYRDLIMMFVKRDVITVYKQTILGPVWFFIQPLMTSLMFILIFDRMANIGTDGIPPILFYLGSVTIWNYFSDTLNITSKTFIENATIFGKVYFPRLIIPISKVISGMIKLLIQFLLFFIFWIYYTLVTHTIHPNFAVFVLPVLLLLMIFLSLGLGLLITALTTKYRDLSFLITFGVQLLMYVTPVIYPLNKYPKYQHYLLLNPLSSIFELFKYSFYGKGYFNIFWFIYSLVFTVIALFCGVVVFNKSEKSFIDKV